ncbi:MAG: large subunit ribosomal protein [Candidatus Methanomethylophilaceae archaeon]|nr:large subunit ribosomal protein [Candidatus Methanomethylophilaceae archaeon]MDI3541652.1 large subunit ribosomal protein [Candidatus Methanomethylophilaceae archaeon]HIJ00910.1 50S ribosomal protein L2 [Candidatus Methanomethylophilaceae archaeon]
MGKRLITQRRGRGGSQYRSPSHRHVSEVRYPRFEGGVGKVVDLVHAPGRTSPLALVDFDGDKVYTIAAEGMKVGQTVQISEAVQVRPGNIMYLANIPDGTPVYNIEGIPGDGGKYIRTAGTSGTVVSRSEKVSVMMPSGELKQFDPRCRGTVGVVAGGGRTEKPLGKSGKKYHTLRSRSKAYFKVSGVAMNPVDHPHGGGSHQHVGRPSTVSRNAPPGRKVGRLSPKKRSK